VANIAKNKKGGAKPKSNKNGGLKKNKFQQTKKMQKK
jgi:hypothetical protein